MASQSISEDSLKAAIIDRLKASHVDITDMSGLFSVLSLPKITKVPAVPYLILTLPPSAGGCGQAFSVVIVSPEFSAKNSLKRHRLVNSALKEEIAAIHAWTAKCHTPEEWQKSQAAAVATEPPLDGTVDGKVEGTRA